MAADCDEGESPSPSEAQPTPAPAAPSGGKRRNKKKNKKKGPRPGPAAGPLDVIEPEPGAGYEPDPALAALLEELGLGRHQALLDAHEFELESVQLSTATDLEEIGLPPDASAAIVAHFKPAPEPEPEADEPELELSASAQQLVALTAAPMAAWSEEQVLTWVELVELEPETRAALRTAFEDDGDTDGEELVAMTAKQLQKMLKRAGMQGDLPAAAQAVLALRDALLAPAVASSPVARRV